MQLLGKTPSANELADAVNEIIGQKADRDKLSMPDYGTYIRINPETTSYKAPADGFLCLVVKPGEYRDGSAMLRPKTRKDYCGQTLYTYSNFSSYGRVMLPLKKGESGLVTLHACLVDVLGFVLTQSAESEA